jgi:hypothetical protein
MSNELQTALALAVTGLEQSKRELLEIFAWASTPRMISPEERSRHAMAIALARSSLPVIDSSLRQSFKILTGHNPPAMGDWPETADKRTSDPNPASGLDSDKKD